VYVREDENGKRCGSPKIWTWQSHAPAGTSNFTAVAGWDAEGSSVVQGRITAAATAAAAVTRASRRDNMPILPCVVALSAIRRLDRREQHTKIASDGKRILIWRERIAPRSSGVVAERTEAFRGYILAYLFLDFLALLFGAAWSVEGQGHGGWRDRLRRRTAVRRTCKTPLNTTLIPLHLRS
jgi:hypothetical protein